MRFFDVEMLKGLSSEDMERLRGEIKELNRRVRAELDTRKRYCAHCGEKLGTSVYGFKYCSAWHRYLDGHNSSEVSRVEFERKRAINRIRTIKSEAEGIVAVSHNSDAKRTAEFKASLRSLRIKRILDEYRTITGESLKKSIRNKRRSKASEK
jgi:hypothetical protein